MLGAARRINPVDHADGRPVLAIDLGGTQIRAALVTPDRTAHCRRSTDTRDELWALLVAPPQPEELSEPPGADDGNAATTAMEHNTTTNEAIDG